jgi:hypothetical protein
MSPARALLALLLCAALPRTAPADGARPEAFGSDERAHRAWLAFEQGEPIRARELAQRLLAEEPGSFAAHCLLARSLRASEGNPAPALLHARACRERFEARHGSEPPEDAPWFWHRFALYELYAASEELERHADSLRWLDALERYYPGRVDAFRGWPLLRLGRLDEGREAARRALARRANRVQVAKAWTVLCALEAQAGDREAAYAACRSALETGPNPDDRAVRLVNTAEAARALARFDETEALLRDATRHFSPAALASPWLELLELYVDQGRVPDAREALREMLDWQRRQPLALRAHSGARHERATTLFLLASGRADEAARVAERALEAPDRAGESSASRAELELASALLARASCLAAAEQRLEEASWSGPGARLRAWLDAVRLRTCAWRAQRRAAARLADGDGYAPGTLQLPEWLEPDVVAVAGAGGMQEILRRSPAGLHGRVYAAEAALQRGEARAALAHALAALEQLPETEVLVRARAALLAGSAEHTLGDASSAAEHFALALQLDGGALRRARSALPVRLEPDDSDVARIAVRVLNGSPRLRGQDASLRLALRADAQRAGACLLDAAGARLDCADVELRAGDSPLRTARRLAAAVHARLF